MYKHTTAEPTATPAAVVAIWAMRPGWRGWAAAIGAGAAGGARAGSAALGGALGGGDAVLNPLEVNSIITQCTIVLASW